MLKTITKNKAVSFKQVTLVSKHTTKQPSTYLGFTTASIKQFINANGGGSYNNITVVPCNNVNLKNTPPINFGYNGGKGTKNKQFGGTRALILNCFLFGVNANNTPALNGNGNYNLNAIYKALKLYPSTQPFLWGAKFLLNGGTSPSNSAWGISFIKLVANQTK
tara:strand:- start:95 stop:586 length:492 start_codon:yes stop_codon:yes gene_type:complete